MRPIFLTIGLAQGLAVVGVLFLIQAIVQSFAPGWSLPFSVWWGMIFSLPALAMAVFAQRTSKRWKRWPRP